MCLGLVDTTEWKYLEQRGARQGYQAFPFLSAKPQEIGFSWQVPGISLHVAQTEIINTNHLCAILLSGCIAMKIDMG